MSNLLSMTIGQFLSETAAKQPTPGGGSVAALAGALAASLATMALNYTAGKKAFAAHDVEIRAGLAEFERASLLFQELIAEDIAAYEALSQFLKLPEDQRLARPEYTTAVVAAIRAPQTAGGLAAAVLQRCHALVDKTNRHLVSDLVVAAVFAHATVHASQLNVLVNLQLLPSKDEAATLRQGLNELSEKADKTYQEIRERMLRTL